MVLLTYSFNMFRRRGKITFQIYFYMHHCPHNVSHLEVVSAVIIVFQIAVYHHTNIWHDSLSEGLELWFLHHDVRVKSSCSWCFVSTRFVWLNVGQTVACFLRQTMHLINHFFTWHLSESSPALTWQLVNMLGPAFRSASPRVVLECNFAWPMQTSVQSAKGGGTA